MPDQTPATKPGVKKGPFVAGAVFIASLLALLAPSEGGRRLAPYLDSVGIATACVGIIGPEVTRRYKAHETFTEDECKALEYTYLSTMVRQMSRCVPANVMAQVHMGEMLAYAHWAYNTGTNAFCGNSSLHRKLVAGDHAGACKAMGNWTFVTLNGVKVNCRLDKYKRLCGGIPKRRDYEVQMCLEAL